MNAHQIEIIMKKNEKIVIHTEFHSIRVTASPVFADRASNLPFAPPQQLGCTP